MSKEFDYSQFEKYVETFEKMTKEFDTFLKQFLLEMAQRVVADAKRNTPVDTGALRNSYFIGSQQVALKETGGTSKSGRVEVTFDPENSTILDINVVGNNFEVLIGNQMEYASYVEYGHALKDGRWKAGYFMLTVAIDKVQKQIPKRFESAFKQFMMNRGVG